MGYAVYRCAEWSPISAVVEKVFGSSRHACSAAAGLQVATAVYCGNKMIMLKRRESELLQRTEDVKQATPGLATPLPVAEPVLPEESLYKSPEDELAALRTGNDTWRRASRRAERKAKGLESELRSERARCAGLEKRCKNLEEKLGLSSPASASSSKVDWKKDHPKCSKALLSSLQQRTPLRPTERSGEEDEGDLLSFVFAKIKKRGEILARNSSQCAVAEVMQFQSYFDLVTAIMESGEVQTMEGEKWDVPQAVIHFLQGVPEERQAEILEWANTELFVKDANEIYLIVVNEVLNLYIQRQERQGLPPSESVALVDMSVHGRLPDAPSALGYDPVETGDSS